MKKLIVTFLLMISVLSLVNAQFTKIGGGLTYGTGYHLNNHTEGIDADLYRSPFAGIFLTGIYELNPSYSYFPFLYIFYASQQITQSLAITGKIQESLQ